MERPLHRGESLAHLCARRISQDVTIVIQNILYNQLEDWSDENRILSAAKEHLSNVIIQELDRDSFSLILRMTLRILPSAALLLALSNANFFDTMEKWPLLVTNAQTIKSFTPCLSLFLERLPPSLIELNLQSYMIDDQLFGILSTSRASATLRSLSMSESLISDASTASWQRFESLEYLDFNSINRISLESVRAISKLRTLRHLNLSLDKVDLVETLRIICQAEEMDNLTYLDVSGLSTPSGSTTIVSELLHDRANRIGSAKPLETFLCHSLPSINLFDLPGICHFSHLSISLAALPEIHCPSLTQLFITLPRPDAQGSYDLTPEILNSVGRQFPHLTSLSVTCRTISPMCRFDVLTNLRGLFLGDYSFRFQQTFSDNIYLYDEFLNSLCDTLPDLDYLNLRLFGPWRRRHFDQICSKLTRLEDLHLFWSPEGAGDEIALVRHESFLDLPAPLHDQALYEPVYCPQIDIFFGLDSDARYRAWAGGLSTASLPNLDLAWITSDYNISMETNELIWKRLEALGDRIVILSIDYAPTLRFFNPSRFKCLSKLIINADLHLVAEEFQRTLLDQIPQLLELSLNNYPIDPSQISHRRMESLLLDEISDYKAKWQICGDNLPRLCQLRLSLVSIASLVISSCMNLRVIESTDCRIPSFTTINLPRLIVQRRGKVEEQE